MKYVRLGTICKSVSTVLVLLASQSASAAGFYISEVGTPLSLGTAGVANPTNNIGADSSWSNPAGMTGLNHSEALGGLQVVAPNIRAASRRSISPGVSLHGIQNTALRR